LVVPRSLSITLLACSFALPLAAVSEPVQVYRGTAHDAFFGLCLDGQQGIAVGGAGLVIESADGGQSWTPAAQAFTESALLDVSCGAGTSLIVAQEGGIYRQSDGAYQAVDSGTDARLLSVASNSHGLAFAVGSFGAILRSEDGGLTWESLSTDWEAILNDFVEPHLYDVTVSETGVVTIVGEFELVVRSQDGGETWETVHIGEASLFGLNLNADGSGFAVGQEGRIIGTTDGGASWAEVPTPTGSILLNVWSRGDDVLVSGIRNVLRSSDGGATWTLIDGGDLNTGWYQGLVVIGEDGAPGATALLAGHQGSVIELQLH
jgi:photosystem II stability/assembly factor-like uncharacterized protein